MQKNNAHLTIKEFKSKTADSQVDVTKSLPQKAVPSRDSIFKMVTSLNKSLIAAEQQAKMAGEEINDLAFMATASTENQDVNEDALEAIRSATSYIQKASQLCSIAKSILMSASPSPVEEINKSS